MEIIQNHKYNLVVCEIFNRYIHGFDKNSYDCVKGHYLCMHVSRNRTIFDERDYEDDDDDEDYAEDDDECHVNDIVDLHGAYYVDYVSKPIKKHDIIRNYRKIISKNDYIQPHIAEVIYLPSGESDMTKLGNSIYFLFYKNKEVPTFGGISRISPVSYGDFKNKLTININTNEIPQINETIAEAFKGMKERDELTTLMEFNGEKVRVFPKTCKVIFLFFNGSSG